MKKFLTIVMTLLMIVSFVACSNDAPVNETDEEIVSNKTENKEENVEGSADSEEVEPEIDIKEEDASKEPEKAPETSDKESEKEQPTEKEPVENNNKSLGNKLLSEFKSVAGSGDALAVAEKLSAYSELSVLPMGAMAVEPGLLTGFDNAEIKGFKEGAMFAPMMGTIPFVGYVFTLEDGADVSAFISTLKSSSNRRWNICTEAEETVTGSSGNKVFFVMCNKSLEE